MIPQKFSGAILEFSPVSWEMGHSTLSLPFLGLIFWFLIDTSAFRQKFKNRSSKFLVNYPERLCFKFQTYILTLGWENRANIIFHESQKRLKSVQNDKKVIFFTYTKLYNQYDLVSCTTESQHIKFEVIWSIGLEIIAI